MPVISNNKDNLVYTEVHSVLSLRRYGLISDLVFTELENMYL